MAELKGPLLFTGSIGNIRAYYNKTLKRYFLSNKGGSTRELIANNPTFARQLENMSEFKGCGIWSSQLRKSLASIGHLHQGYYFGEIVALSKRLQKNDNINTRGIRSIESSKNPRLLTTLNFNQCHPFDQVLSHPYNIAFSDNKQTVTLSLMGLRSFFALNWPVRFDSYRIALVIAQLPDVVYRENGDAYQPAYPHMERLSVCTLSDWLPSTTEPEDLILTASFAQPALQQPGTTVVVALGVEVSVSLSGSSPYSMAGNGTMRIVECYAV